MEPPLTDTSIQRTPPNNGQIFSSQNTPWQKVTPPYSGHLSTTDDKIGPIGVRYMEVTLYGFLKGSTTVSIFTTCQCHEHSKTRIFKPFQC